MKKLFKLNIKIQLKKTREGFHENEIRCDFPQNL